MSPKKPEKKTVSPAKAKITKHVVGGPAAIVHDANPIGVCVDLTTGKVIPQATEAPKEAAAPKTEAPKAVVAPETTPQLDRLTIEDAKATLEAAKAARKRAAEEMAAAEEKWVAEVAAASVVQEEAADLLRSILEDEDWEEYAPGRNASSLIETKILPDDWADFGKKTVQAVIVAGAVAGATYGVYKLIEWMCSDD